MNFQQQLCICNALYFIGNKSGISFNNAILSHTGIFIIYS